MYSIVNQFDDEKFVLQLKRLHKKVFELLTFISEIRMMNKPVPPYTAQSIIYLDETISDLMQALFCWANGAYKPAKMLL